MADDKPIIIIKKKGGHGGHSGGAWKVAYADFVTAMMAFFMVMWLLSAASSKQRVSIASYFRKPGIFAEGSGTPLMMGEAGILSDGYVPPHPETQKQLYSGKSMEELKKQSGTDDAATGDKRVTYRGTEGKRDSVPDDDIAQRGFQSDKSDTDKLVVNLSKEKSGFKDDEEAKAAQAANNARLNQAAAEIRKQLEQIPEIKELLGAIEIKPESNGLSIEIMDTDKTSMFQSGSARILPQAEGAFAKVLPVLNRFKAKIDVIGHTDSAGFARRAGGYSNWELSADRANAARRLLERLGVAQDRFNNVTGRADRDLKFPNLPSAASNRRITLKLTLERKELATTSAPLNARGEVDQRNNAAAKSQPSESAVSKLFDSAQSSSGAQPPSSERATADQANPGQNTSSSSSLRNLIPEPTPASPLTAKELLDPVKRARREKIKLSDAPVPTENPAPQRSGDRIFNDAPVIGPRDPFMNLE